MLDMKTKTIVYGSIWPYIRVFAKIYHSVNVLRIVLIELYY